MFRVAAILLSSYDAKIETAKSSGILKVSAGKFMPV
jgi:hypothetical protein